MTAWWDQSHVGADVEGYRDMGVPDEAIRSDGSLDADLLRSQGWRLDEYGMAPPPDHVSTPPVERDDGTTWRMNLTLESEL
jgi:hypothetical protein